MSEINTQMGLAGTEEAYKLNLLRRFSLIALCVVIATMVSQLAGLLASNRGFGSIIAILSALTPYIALGVISYWLARRNKYRAGSWVLIINCLLLTLIGSFFSNTDVPIIFFYVIPIALTVILLGGRETLAIGIICALSVAALFILQDGFHILTPKPSSEGGRVSTGLVIAIVIIPAFTALLYLPFKGLLEINRRQNRRLQETLAELESRQQTSQSVSQNMLNVVGSLNSSASQQATVSEQQLAIVTQVNTSVTELSHAASQIETLAAQISQSANQVVTTNEQVETTIRRSVDQSGKGLEAVAGTVSVSNDVAVLYQQLVTTMEELTLKNANMRMILDLLTSIATETHLLSLNAAIEAAGVGEQGARFSVVAAEVKDLANRSAAASREVVAIINEIEDTTRQAVESAQQGYSKAQQMTEVAQQTGQVIELMRSFVEESQTQAVSIGQAIKEVHKLGQVIQSATTHQRIASQQVHEALQSLSSVASETASSSGLVSDNAVKLEELSQHLNLALTA